DLAPWWGWNNDTLYVIDISTPSSPSIIGSIDTLDYAYGVYVSGNYAYVADWFLGLQVIDISTPSSPTIIAHVYTLGYPNDVYVSGNYAYVAGIGGLPFDDGSLSVIDISTPSSPTIIGSVITPGEANNVYVSGNYAYVTGGSSLQLIDINIPSSPKIISYVYTPGRLDWTRASGVYVSDGYAYVADGDSGLQIIMAPQLLDSNVEDSTTITATIPADLPEGAYNIFVTNPGGEVGILHNGFRVIVDGVADGIVDNTDPGFSVIGTWHTSTAAPDFYDNDFLYAGSPSGGTGSNQAIWDAELIDGPGFYEVFIWYPTGNITTVANMPFTINHAGLSNTILVDRSVNGGQWVSLGIFNFIDDGTERVTLLDNANSWVVADAVKFTLPDGI
ncbi:MAG: hypothetical protein HY999_00040, partial [Nitrospinae bacterium]|nr:hypothetical protein [Nitrospinota bacterium]